MMQTPPEQQYTAYFTWPKDVLYADDGQFSGYIMQRLNSTQKLNEMYSYDHRAGRSWRVYINIAQNLAAAVHGVHKQGHVCGDLNPNNICVNPETGIITLVDTDSYHIRDPKSGMVFCCEVGMGEFLPNELQGINFKSAALPTFTTETDLFALAVLIFALLMNGAHPFAVSVAKGYSGASLQPVTNIVKGLYPYAGVKSGIGIPRYAPEISMLPSNIQSMFLSAFLTKNTEKRPTAYHWHYALQELATKLKDCDGNPNHVMYRGVAACPWCYVNQKMRGLNAPSPINPPIQANPIIQRQSSNQPIPNAVIPNILTGIPALIYGGVIGYVVYWLLNHIIFTWGIIGGIVAGFCALSGAVGVSDDFRRDPTAGTFFGFLYSGALAAVSGALGGVVIMFVVIFIGSIIFNIIRWIF